MKSLSKESLQKLAEQSSLHPRQLLGKQKKYLPAKAYLYSEGEDIFGLYRISEFADRHPKLTEVNYCLRDGLTAGSLSLATGLGIHTGLMAGNPGPLLVVALWLVGDATISWLLKDLEPGARYKNRIFPFTRHAIKTIGQGVDTLGYITKYTVTLPAKVVKKIDLYKRYNQRKNILKLDNGEKLLKQHENEIHRNERLKEIAKTEKKQQKFAKRIQLDTQKLGRRNQEMEKSR